MHQKTKKRIAGFTLIELLIVIAILAIIAAIVFVALNPGARFREARNARRWSDASAAMNAIKVDQVDNGGSYLASITAMTAGDVYMITNGGGTDCDGQNANCAVPVTVEALPGDHCVDLAGLITEGYLGSIPISPDGAGTWAADISGYTIQREATGILTIRACESEGAAAIEMSR